MSPTKYPRLMVPEQQRTERFSAMENSIDAVTSHKKTILSMPDAGERFSIKIVFGAKKGQGAKVRQCQSEMRAQ
uniref:Uncharacterized protein n=1 Tax=Romanomermis culicivorax TaxID=13658 RepID=A0A915LB35_ROMCU